MKRIKIILMLLISMFIFKINAFAASGNLSVSKSSVYVGESFTVSVNVNSAAAWNVHVSATGPVQNCSINQADATADAMDTNKTFTATCTATATGTITINLNGDVTSAMDGNSVIISGNKTVNVVAKPTQPTTPTPSPIPQPKPQPTTPQNNLSKNNNIKSLSVEGYDLVKIDNNNYTLTVANKVSTINVNATLEDTKAKVSGIGSHKLQVGENNIGVIVTAESGTQNKINIKVTRKDGYYLEDLDSILKDEKDIDIIIKGDSKITEEQLNKIKGSKKLVTLNSYDENKKLIYSWSINGKELKDSKEFETAITFTAKNEKEINKLSNYAAGLYVNFKHSGELPTGTKIKLYVGDKFENGSIVNVYHYSNKKLDFIKDNLKVLDGYIEFDIKHCSEYFVTMSTIADVIDEKEDNSSINIFMIFAIIELIVIVCLVIFIKLKPTKEDNIDDIKDNTNNSNLNNDNLN